MHHGAVFYYYYLFLYVSYLRKHFGNLQSNGYNLPGRLPFCFEVSAILLS